MSLDYYRLKTQFQPSFSDYVWQTWEQRLRIIETDLFERIEAVKLVDIFKDIRITLDA